MTDQVKRVYAFGKDANGNNVTEGNTNMKATLGGKGANLAEMANIGLPVPPGFTISCQTCMEYANADNTWPEGVLDTIQEYREDLEARIGKKIGDAEDSSVGIGSFWRSNEYAWHDGYRFESRFERRVNSWLD